MSWAKQDALHNQEEEYRCAFQGDALRKCTRKWSIRKNINSSILLHYFCAITPLWESLRAYESSNLLCLMLMLTNVNISESHYVCYIRFNIITRIQYTVFGAYLPSFDLSPPQKIKKCCFPMFVLNCPKIAQNFIVFIKNITLCVKFSTASHVAA